MRTGCGCLAFTAGIAGIVCIFTGSWLPAIALFVMSGLMSQWLGE
jgi:hypothetical protein